MQVTNMKSRYIAAILAFFLGGLGVHKFYLGKWSGIWYLLFCWTSIPSVIAFVEGVLYLINGEEAFNEKFNQKAMENTYRDVTCNRNDSMSNGQIKSPDNEVAIVCPKCGHMNGAGSNFCESFGQKL